MIRAVRQTAMLLAVACLVACAHNNPFAYADTDLDKAHVALRSFEDVQAGVILPLVSDASIPEAAKEKLRTASHDGALASAELGGGVTEFDAARKALSAGENATERLAIARANLVKWTVTLQERVASIKQAAAEARNEGQHT